MIYAITSTKWEGEIRLEYHENGLLKTAQLPEVFDTESAMYFATHFPIQLNLLEWLKNNTKAKVVEIASPLTFDEFWAAYDKKTGSKELARQYWEGEKRTINKRPITDTDRQIIMNMVRRFAAKYRGEKKEFQPLASSWLNQRYWESEAEATPRRNDASFAAANALAEKWTIKK